VLAQSTDNNPVILCAENDSGGRVVVDTGFTKLWVKWQSAGTDRYVCNATVWLLALEYRLNKGFPLHGATNTIIRPRGNTPLYAPVEVKSGKADVILVVDGSGSVRPTDFNDMRNFSIKLAKKLVKARLVEFGVVQFSEHANVVCPLTSKMNQLNNNLHNMKQIGGGTNFDAGLDRANKQFNNRDWRASKIIIFQTDGEGSTTLAKPLREQGVTIFAIGVGPGVVDANLIALAGPREYTMRCNSYDKLQPLISTIVGQVARSTST